MREHTSIISLVLLSLSTALLFFPKIEAVFIVAVFFSCALAIIAMVFLITKPKVFKLSSLLAASLLLGYSFGTAMVVIRGYYYGVDSIYTYYAMGIIYGTDDLSMALLLVLLAVLVLNEISRLENNIVDKLISVTDEDETGMGKYVFICGSIIIYALFSGEIGYSGIIGGEHDDVSALGALAMRLVPAFLPIVACELLNKGSMVYKFLMLVFLVLLIVLCMVFGRRVLLFSLVLTVIGLSIYGYGINNFVNRKLIITILLIIAAALFLWFGFGLFYAMRGATYDLGKDAPLIDLIRASIGVMFLDTGSLNVQLSANVMERPFILSYLAGLVSAQGVHSPLMGKEMEYAIQTAIPSVFFPEKLYLLPKMAEEFVHPLFGLPVFDGNNTILTAGFNDYGVIGVVIYPVIMLVVYYIFLMVMNDYLPLGLFRIVFFILLFRIMFIEDSLSSLLFLGIRDSILIVAIFYSFSRVIDLVKGFFKGDRFIEA